MKLIRDDDIDLLPYMGEAEASHKVNSGNDWTQSVIDHFYRPDDTPKLYLPWAKTHADFHFREGEVTLWGGINSHGKSMVVSHVMLGLMQQGEAVGIASLEMQPTMTMARMHCQAWGGALPSMDFIKRFGRWTDGKLWLYDHVGTCDPQTMLAVVRYTISQFKVKHFVVDNLSKVIRGDSGEKVYNEQKDFVNGLCEIGNATRTHLHLVAHMRKGEKEENVPGKFDFKGSGALTDLVDNVFVVWRNKQKEQKNREEDYSLQDAPDAILKLEKQRNKGIEGGYGLWFDPASMQYLSRRGDLAQRLNIDEGISLDEVSF